MEDINQHFEQLRRLLVKIGYPHSVDKERFICIEYMHHTNIYHQNTKKNNNKNK